MFPVFQAEIESYSKVCEDAYGNAKKTTAIYNTLWLDSPWSGFFGTKDPMKPPSTGVQEDVLQHIAKVFSSEPDDPQFKLHGGIYFWLKP